MHLETVGIDDHGRAAHSAEPKSALAFLDEVFHLPAATVVLDHLLRDQIFHRCNHKGEQMDELPGRFLDLKDHPAGMIPAAGLVHKLTIDNCVVNGITKMFDLRKQFCVLAGRKLSETGVLLKPNGVFAVLLFQYIVQFRRSKTAVAPHVKSKREVFGRIVCPSFF